MRNLRKTLTVAGAFVAGGLAGYVMWLLSRQDLPEPPRPWPDEVEGTGEEEARGEEEGREEEEKEDRDEKEPGDETAERDETGEREGPDDAVPPPAGVASPDVPGEPGPAEPVRPLDPQPLRDPSWRVWGAPFRQTVEIALVSAAGGGKGDLPHGPVAARGVARCRVALGEAAAAEPRLRVFNTEGKEVRSRLVPDTGGRKGGAGHDLYFEAGKAKPGDRFEVYYPAAEESDAPALPRLDAGPSPDGDLLVTVFKVDPAKISGGRKRLRGLSNVLEAMKGAKPVSGPGGRTHVRRTHIDDRESPYGPDYNYVAVYQSYLACPRDGSYEFGIDADDLAVLVVDGREVLTGGSPGKLPDRPFPYRTKRKLKAGLHAIALYHVQTTELLRARLAWRPESAGAIRIIPPSAFVSHVRARPVRLDLRDRPGPTAFFRAEPVRRLVVNRSVPVTLWELAATEIDAPELPEDLPTAPPSAKATEGSALRSSEGAKEGAKWVWREGDRVLGEGREIGVHVSGLGGPSSLTGGGPVSRAGSHREITLALRTEDGEHSVYTRRLRALDAPPEETEGLTLRLELASAPNFVYSHEGLKLVVRAINDSAEPVRLEVIERAWKADPSGDAAACRRLGEFELPAVGKRGADVLAKRMNVISLDFAPEDYAGLDRLVYYLGPPGAPAVKLEIRLLPSREQVLPVLRAEAGGFVAGADGRALFVLPYDRESDRRRFAFLKSLTARGGDSRKALLYGDDLSSSGARGGKGLVPRMRAGLGERVELRHVPFPEGGYPIDAAVAGIDAALLEENWGRIWISVGTLDVRAGTPVREFARGLDMLVDRVRAVRPGARLVIVGPPPEWSREDVSRRYAEAAREVAGQHHVPLAELHELVMELVTELVMDQVEGPAAATASPWREDADDVYFPYPLGDAMDEIAREVLGR